MSAIIGWLSAHYATWRGQLHERFARARRWVRLEWDRRRPARRVVVIEGDMLPPSLPTRDIVLLRDDGEDWSVGMRCPCGCGETIELMLLRQAKPRISSSMPVIGRACVRRSGARPVAARISGCGTGVLRGVISRRLPAGDHCTGFQVRPRTASMTCAIGCMVRSAFLMARVSTVLQSVHTVSSSSITERRGRSDLVLQPEGPCVAVRP
jgi:hypothetical protein